VYLLTSDQALKQSKILMLITSSRIFLKLLDFHQVQQLFRYALFVPNFRLQQVAKSQLQF